jgi:hypothetical protein
MCGVCQHVFNAGASSGYDENPHASNANTSAGFEENVNEDWDDGSWGSSSNNTSCRSNGFLDAKKTGNNNTSSSSELPGFISNQATNGLIEMLRSCLQKGIAPYRLCSPCTHLTQRNAMGAEWACGFRNIQMLCLSLVQSPAYRPLLFNGDGEVPDIHGIQAYIERAWVAGFDVAGAADFKQGLLGTSVWVGATECTALLRYFGLRAHLVDFFDEAYMVAMMNGEVAFEAGNESRGVTSIANYVCDYCGGKPEGFRYHCTVRDNFDLCESCMTQFPDQPHPTTKIKVQSRFAKVPSSSSFSSSSAPGAGGAAQYYGGGGRLAFVPLDNHVSKTSSSGRHTQAPSNYSDFGGQGCEGEKEGGGGEHDDDNDGGEWERWEDGGNICSSGGSPSSSSSGNYWGDKKRQKKERTPTKSGNISSFSPTKKAKANVPSENSAHLMRWIERYFTEFAESSNGIGNNNNNDSSGLSMKERCQRLPPDRCPSGLTHPLYLQHDGHSRTIVGYQQESLKTNMLMFDPAASGSTLERTLSAQRGWQRLVKRQLSTFNQHSAFQVVYVSGVMSEREQEASKTLTPKKPEDLLLTEVELLA